MRSGRPRFLGADILTCSVIWCNAASLSWSLQDGGSAVGRLAVGHNGITWHAWRLAQSAGSPLTEQQTRLASGYMFTKVHRHAKGAKPSARIKTLRSSSTWELLQSVAWHCAAAMLRNARCRLGTRRRTPTRHAQWPPQCLGCRVLGRPVVLGQLL